MNYSNSLTLNESFNKTSYSRICCDISREQKQLAKDRQASKVDAAQDTLYIDNGQCVSIRGSL